jgi:hypothetical protein
MKRYFSLLLMATAVFVLGGCASTGTPESGDSSNFVDYHEAVVRAGIMGTENEILILKKALRDSDARFAKFNGRTSNTSAWNGLQIFGIARIPDQIQTLYSGDLVEVWVKHPKAEKNPQLADDFSTWPVVVRVVCRKADPDYKACLKKSQEGRPVIWGVRSFGRPPEMDTFTFDLKRPKD